MKKIIIFLTFLTITQSLTAQEIISETNTYKKGIYKTYEEFLNNEPSLDLSYERKTKKMSYGLMGLGGSLEVQRFKIKKKDAKNLGGIFGFSDGKNIFINPSALKSFSPGSSFYTVEFIGNFCYFEFIKRSSVTTGSQTTTSNSLGKALIDLKNNKAISLDKFSLRRLIEDDKELLESFNAESNKNKKLKEYVTLCAEIQ